MSSVESPTVYVRRSNTRASLLQQKGGFPVSSLDSDFLQVDLIEGHQEFIGSPSEAIKAAPLSQPCKVHLDILKNTGGCTDVLERTLVPTRDSSLYLEHNSRSEIRVAFILEMTNK